jgi:ABC-type multidrug transport system fused ATPase/permease subunit
MMNSDLSSYDESPVGELPPPSTPTQTQKDIQEARQRTWIIVGIVAVVLLFLITTIAMVIFLANPNTPTEQIRDIMIIFLALEFMILGVAMVIMIIQLATLINLLQNEVKPLLESSNETVNTLRGTAIFLSENLSEPVIRMNEYASGARRFAELIGILRK